MKQPRATISSKKIDQISRLSDKELVDELKSKGLESFGTKNERLDRLKRHLGCLV